MSGKALGWAREQRVASGAPGKALLLLLADYCDGDHTCWPSVPTLAEELQMSERTVQRHLTSLAREELIRREARNSEEGRQKANRYVLAVGRAPTCHPQDVGGEGDTLSPIGVTLCRGEGDTRVTPGGDTRVTPTTLNHLEEPPETHTQGERARGNDDPLDVGFAEAMAAYPETGRVRTNAAVARRRWAEAVTLIAPDRLVAAIRRYAAEDRDLKRGDHGAPKLERWLEGERWRVWLADADGRLPVTAPCAFAGPPELRAAVIEEAGPAKGESFAASYLDPCGWDEARRVLTARTGVAADRLTAAARRVFDRMGVSVRGPTPAAGGA